MDIWCLSEIWFLSAAGAKCAPREARADEHPPEKPLYRHPRLGHDPRPAEEVSGARAFVARTLAAADKTPPLDSDAATLLTSELVANAIQHTASGAPGGTVTIVVVDVPDGVLVEVIDDGSDGTPVVKRDVLTTNGHGLLLVQQLAAQWGYLRDPAGTTVWFHLSCHWEPDGG